MTPVFSGKHRQVLPDNPVDYLANYLEEHAAIWLCNLCVFFWRTRFNTEKKMNNVSLYPPNSNREWSLGINIHQPFLGNIRHIHCNLQPVVFYSQRV